MSRKTKNWEILQSSIQEENDVPCAWMILGLARHKGNSNAPLAAWNDDWNWPWSKISSQACHWKLLHNHMTDVTEHTRDECILRVRISCTKNWCAVLMLPGIKWDKLQGVLSHCSTHLNRFSDLLLSSNLAPVVLLYVLSTGGKPAERFSRF